MMFVLYTLRTAILFFICRGVAKCIFPNLFWKWACHFVSSILICVMNVDCIKYSSLKVQAQESHCLDSSLGIRAYFLYCSSHILRFLQIEGLWQSSMEQIYCRRPFFKQHLLTLSLLCHILVILTIFQTFALLLYLLWCFVIGVDVTILIIWGHHKPQLYKMVNLIVNVVCSDCSTDWLFPASLPLLAPPYSLRCNNIEIRPINNATMASKCPSERKSPCLSL